MSVSASAHKKRTLDLPRLGSLLTPLLAVIVAMAIVGLLLLSIGINPLSAYGAMYLGALGNTYARAETLVKMSPLLFCGLGVAVAFRSRLWNIGAEGQLFMGAVFSTGVGAFMGPMSPWIHVPLMFLAGFAGGALWAFVPGLLKARFQVNEAIVTVMLNYVAIEVVSYLVNGPWKDPKGSESYSPPIGPTAELPILWPQTRLHLGVLVAGLAVIAVYLLLNHTVLGFRLRGAGTNPRAARYAGISVARTTILSLMISGGLAGLAGVGEIGGTWHRLLTDISPGYGYTAIVIALLGQLNSFGVLAASFLFAVLVVGADSMQRVVGAPAAMVLIVQALVILAVLAADYIWRSRQP